MSDFLLRTVIGICVGVFGGLGAAKVIDVISTASAASLNSAVLYVVP